MKFSLAVTQEIIDLYHDIFFFLILILVFFLILILVFVLWMLVREWAYTLLMEGQSRPVGAAAAAAGPSAPGRGRDSEDDRERLRARIRRRIARIHRAFCLKYFRGVDWSGRFCEPGRESLSYQEEASKIAETFSYSTADVSSLRNLLRFLKKNRNPARWDADSRMHVLGDLISRGQRRG